jgi:hypothetical protein
MPLASIAYVDPFELQCSLASRLNHFQQSEVPGLRRFDLRYQDEEGAWRAHGETRKWPQLRNTLSRIMRIAKEALRSDKKLENGCVVLEMLDPGNALPWIVDRSDYRREHIRLVYTLRSNPAAMLFVGLEACAPTPGRVEVLPNVPMTAINLGETALIALVIDVRT